MHLERTIPRCAGPLAAAALLAATAAVGPSPAAEPARPSANDLGLVAYEVHRFPDGGVHAVLRTDDGPAGTLEARGDIDGRVHVAYEPEGGPALRLLWEPSLSRLGVTGEAGRGEAAADPSTGDWWKSPGFRDIESEHGLHLMRALHAVGDLRGEAGERTGSCGGDVSGAAKVDCAGKLCRGSTVGATRSACCEKARQGADLCCDRYSVACDGCCKWRTCDGTCALGDYVCVCGRTGTACVNVIPGGLGGPSGTMESTR